MPDMTPKRATKFKSVIAKKQPNLTVVMENVHDAHNISAVLRSCDAVGIKEVHIIYTDPNLYRRLGEKSSASAKKWIDVHYYDNIEDCFNRLKSEGKSIFTTHLSDEAANIYQMDFTQKVALVFGNEKDGVSNEALALADGNFIIPQVGMIESLNISVACAVSLYEAFRQKREAGHYENQQMSDEAQSALFNDWAQR